MNESDRHSHEEPWLLEMLKDPHFAEVVRHCWNIYFKKGMDYTQGRWAEDRLSNFYEAAQDAGCSVFTAWAVLFSKHKHAVQRFVKERRLESEPLEQRAFDVINYMILLLLIVEREAKKELGQGKPDETAPDYRDRRIA